MRPKPTTVPGAVSRKTDAQLGLITQTRKYELITPLFGGGVEAGKNDTSMPVNGKSIRGQLRFWWRATRGSNQHVHDTLLRLGLPVVKMNEHGQPMLDASGNTIPLTDLEKLRRLEGEIWGLASGDEGKPSNVQVLVHFDSAPEELPYHAWWEWNLEKKKWYWRSDIDKIAPAYAVFPLRPEPDESSKPNQPGTRDKQQAKRRECGFLIDKGFIFAVKLSFPAAIQDEVEAALWAWEIFGGIGGRTRRGFGAFTRVGINVQDWTEHIATGFSNFKNGNSPDGISRISNRYHVVRRNWFDIVERYQHFRQGAHFARNGGRGRSRWPEPDEIRRTVGRHSTEHAPVHPVRKFPRARLGMPIIFHFKDRDDPPETSLKPANAERLASPLILRPLSEEWSIAAILETSGHLMGGLELRNAPERATPPDPTLVHPEETQSIHPMRTYTTADILEAVLNHLR